MSEQMNLENKKWEVLIFHSQEELKQYHLSARLPRWVKGKVNLPPYNHGILVNDLVDQKSEILSAEKALQMLKELKDNEDWKTGGVSITEEVFHLPSKPGQKTDKGGEVQENEQKGTAAKPPSEYREVMHLPVEVSQELFDLLEKHEAILQKWADEDEKLRTYILTKAYNLILSWGLKDQPKEIDFSKRPLPWTYDERKQTWVCELPPNRGTVYLDDEGLVSWRGTIERPHRFKDKSPYYLEIKEALDWVETELLRYQKEAQEEQEKAASQPQPKAVPFPSAEQLERLQPYWIDPKSLEPKRVVYRIIIDIEYKPIRFKTMELSFGEMAPYDQQYLPPSQLGGQVGLNLNKVEINQPLGEDEGWYHVASLALYNQRELAIQQAQLLWDESRVAALYKSKDVLRARYGIQEEETGYTEWLGFCEDPVTDWSQSISRDQYMEERALQYTIYHALDLDCLRSLLGLDATDVSEARLLEAMHQKRSTAWFLPETVREESQQWLKDHPQKKK